MALDPILSRGITADIAGRSNRQRELTRLEDLAEDTRRRTIEAEKSGEVSRRGAEQQIDITRETRRIADIAKFGIEIRQDVINASNDPAAQQVVVDKLRNRRRSLDERIKAGEDIDTAQTDEALQMATEGNFGGLLQSLNQVDELATRFGAIKPTAQAKDTRGTTQKDFEFRQSLDPSDRAAFDEFIERKGTTKEVIIEGAGTVAQQTRQGFQQEDLQSLFESARAAESSLPEITAAKEQVISGDIDTGLFATLKILGGQAGLDIPDAADLEFLEGLANKQAIPLVKKLGVNPTDKDFEIVKSTVASAGKSELFNIKILATVEAAQKRLVEELKLANTMTEQGASINDIDNARRVFRAQNPIDPDAAALDVNVFRINRNPNSDAIIAKLLADPNLADDFDKKFGEGTAQVFLGDQ